MRGAPELWGHLLGLARVELIIKTCYYGLLMMRGAPEPWPTSLGPSTCRTHYQTLLLRTADNEGST